MSDENYEFIVDNGNRVWIYNPTTDLYGWPGVGSYRLEELDESFGPLTTLNRGEQLDITLPINTQVFVDVEAYKTMTGKVIDPDTAWPNKDSYTVQIEIVVNKDKVKRA